MYMYTYRSERIIRSISIFVQKYIVEQDNFVVVVVCSLGESLGTRLVSHYFLHGIGPAVMYGTPASPPLTVPGEQSSCPLHLLCISRKLHAVRLVCLSGTWHAVRWA